jgi:hypothetical protein
MGQSPNYQDGLRQASVRLDPLAALRSPVTILLGVTEPVRVALASLGLATVMDLATSPLFLLASEIGDAALGVGGSELARLDAIPGGSVVAGGPTRLADLGSAHLSALRSLGDGQAAALESALNVDTIADLGRWIPYRSARAVLDAASGSAPSDGDEATELVPRFGEYPTERRYYSSIVMDHVAVGQTTDLTTAGPIDISPTTAADFGFSAPAVGARLTFQQSWFAQGVTLGNLLHSVALAPGESTRVAVVDWSRQTTASSTESIDETESLTNATSHNRAVSEVQQAVANEVQSGFSHTDSTATTNESGGGLGFSLGPITLGGSASGGSTTTSADSFSTSAGSRDLAASMSQQVADATQQAASSVRNRRASIVKEISETEHESVSTRILANYNHMHALTVQYYEVVEIYRVSVGLHQAERCLFVPMKLTDFTDTIVTKFQGALAAAALTREARELLSTEFGMISLTPVLPMRPFLSDVLSSAVIRTAALARVSDAVTPATPAVTGTDATPAAEPAPASPPATARPLIFTWSADEVRRISRITAATPVRPGAEAMLLPREATLGGVSFSFDGNGPQVTAVTCRQQQGGPDIAVTRTSIGWRVPGELPLENLLEIVVTTGAGTGRATGTMSLELTYHGAYFPVTLPVDVAANASATVVKIGDSDAAPQLIEHLRANSLHYNQAIWRSFDASTVALLLSRFTFEGMPVADLIDPRPIQIAGNYMVFRMPGFVARSSLTPSSRDESTPEANASRTWVQWLSDRGLTFGPETTTDQLVPVPTGGVFAEAVLGRSNSAEKLDATRFWNWQDSPIPLQPPEIAAISMESRAQPIDVTPGQLGQPVLNIVNPTSLPAPTGLGSILGAIQNGNMFRDMSGLAATIGLAQATGADATGAAADAGKLAAANLATAAQKEIEQDKIAAQLAMAAMGNPSAMQGTPKNHSEMNAMVNSGDQRDAAKKAAAASSAGGGASSGGTTTGGGGGGGGSGSSIGGSDADPATDGGSASTALASDDPSLGDLAFKRALFGSLGVPAGDLVLADSGGTSGSGSGSGSTSSVQFVGEIFFYEHVVRTGDLATPAGEVAAMNGSTWKASSVDFRAISIRSAGNRTPRADAEVSTVAQFMTMLAQPASRFNYFGYTSDTDSLSLSATVASNLIVTQPDPSDPSDTTAQMLNLNQISALREIGALSSGGGAMGDLIRKIRSRNKDFRDQAIASGSSKTLRQLWLAMVGGTLSDAYAKALAQALQMEIVIYSDEIVFKPEFTLSPPVVQKRGIIALSVFGPTTEDLHTLDSQGNSFDP